MTGVRAPITIAEVPLHLAAGFRGQKSLHFMNYLIYTMTSDLTQTTSLVVRNENNRVRHMVEASVKHISALDYGERSYSARTAERI